MQTDTKGSDTPDWELELLKLRLDYAWKWFSFHADQRTKMFNFMLIVVGIFATAIVGAYKEEMFVVAISLCVVSGFFALVFTRLDRRNQDLVALGQDVLRELEKGKLFGENTELSNSEGGKLPCGILWQETQSEEAGLPPGSSKKITLKDVWLGKHRIWLRAIATLIGGLFFIAAGLIYIHSNKHEIAKRTVPLVLSSEATSSLELARGWRALEPSPSFAVGAVKFDEKVADCPPPDRTMKAADDWVGYVFRQWTKRGHASPYDGIILIGGADRIPLSNGSRRHYDTNVGLARTRAETVRAMLVDATKDEPSEHKITAERIMVLVTGPRIWAEARPTVKGKTFGCGDPDLAADRTVQVWLPAGS